MTLPIAFSTLGCPDLTIAEVVQLARDHSYASVELRFVAGTTELATLPELRPDQIHHTRALFDDAGVSVVAVDSSISPGRHEDLPWGELREQVLDLCAIANGLGAPYLRVFGGPLRASRSRAEALRSVAETLGRVADLSADHGVTTVLETHDEFSTSASIRRLLEDADTPNLSVLWDTFHTARHGEAPAETWSQIGGFVRHVHVKDGVGLRSGDPRYVLTGSGEIDLEAILSTLTGASYPGTVCFEWEKAWHPEIEPGEVAIPHFAQYIRGRGWAQRQGRAGS